MKFNAQFPKALIYDGILILINYDSLSYKYIASYELGIEKIKGEYYSLDEALEDIKHAIASREDACPPILG